MELGKISEIDNAQLNHVQKTQSVQELDEKYKTIQDDEYKKNESKLADVDPNEVILDNVRFGYNKSSKDFFVKVTRGDAEYKYPTEDMMRVKAQILRELDEQQNNS